MFLNWSEYKSIVSGAYVSPLSAVICEVSVASSSNQLSTAESI